MVETKIFCIAALDIYELTKLCKTTLQKLDSQPEPSFSQLSRFSATESTSDVRLAILARDCTSLQQKLRLVLSRLNSGEALRFSPKDQIHITKVNFNPGKTLLLFPGFGSEFPEMLSGLVDKFPFISKWRVLMEQVLNESNIDVSAENFDSWLEKKISKKGYGVKEGGPLGSLTSLALFDIIKKLGINCHAMVGHSNGENSALIASGAVTYKDEDHLLEIIKSLAQLAPSTENEGQYLAISNIKKEVLQQLFQEIPEALLAMENCPSQKVIYVKNADKKRAIDFVQSKRGLAIELVTDYPYHTKAFGKYADGLKPAYQELIFEEWQTPIFSCIDAQVFPKSPEAIKEKAFQQWFEPVLFEQTILGLHDKGFNTFIEVGPNNRLTSFVQDTLRGKAHVTCSSSNQRHSAWDGLLSMCVELWVNHHPVNLAMLMEPIHKADKALNNSSFHTRIFNSHQKIMQQFLGVHHRVTASYLGKANGTEKVTFRPKISTPLISGIPQPTENGIEINTVLNINHHRLIKDHSMGGVLPVVPFTLSMELMTEAALLLIGKAQPQLTISELKGLAWLVFEDDEINLKINADYIDSPDGSKQVSVKIHLAETGACAFQGVLSTNTKGQISTTLELIGKKEIPSISVADFYKDHLFHATCFRSIYSVQYWNKKVVKATFIMPDLTTAISNNDPPHFSIPGPMLDGTGQLLAYWMYEQGERDYAIFPYSAEKFEQYSQFPAPGSLINCHASIMKDASTIAGTFEFIDQDNNCIGRLTNFRLRIFKNEWIPHLLMNRLDQSAPNTIGEDFLKEGGGIWNKLMGRLLFKNLAYQTWLNKSQPDQINELSESWKSSRNPALLELKTTKI